MVKNFTHVYSSPLPLLLLHDLSGVLLVDSLYEGNIVHVPSIRVLKLAHYQLQNERGKQSKQAATMEPHNEHPSMADIYYIMFQWLLSWPLHK